MGIGKQEDQIARQDRKKGIRPDCGNSDGTRHLTRGDVDEGGIVTCGQCNGRIL